MFKFRSTAALICLAIGLVGCGSRFVGIDPALAPEQRDQAQRDARRPPIETDTRYETVTVESDLAIPLDRFVNWFTTIGAPQFASFMTGTPAVSGAARSDPLIGSWRKVGDRRRVVFADGKSEIEEITADQKPELFQYEMWNLTNDMGRYITYGLADFSFAGRESGTHIRWTYSFRPLAWPDGWFISRVVHEDFRQFMETTLAAMQARALSDLARK
ncbi:SRPBCC family protein [Bradyrhizobium sp. dw_78]|uniref:SRPBCC family protein n=1 Tax=Bradyrhizobium sp. dw_78 TaxID=2719793 RepID=UPI001BD4EE25|nr:SRPBCC family protein [Bradyrhizobium sp. dw_78]